MDALIRVASLSHKISLGDPTASANEILHSISDAKIYAPDVYLFPSFSLTGSQLGDLAFHKTMISNCETAMTMIANQTKRIDAYLVIGGLLFQNNRPQSAIYVLYKGEIQAILTQEDSDYVFAVRDIKFNVFSTPLAKLPQAIGSISALGCDLTLVPDATPARAGSVESQKELLSFVSKSCACGIAYAGGCIGDTSFPYQQRNVVGNYECGKTLAQKQSLQASIFTVTDFDADIIRAEKSRQGLPLYNEDFCALIQPPIHSDLLRLVEPEPYLPTDNTKRTAYLLDLFQLQSASLATRLKNIHCERIVIGISGGLDSTLALLVCANAMSLLGLSNRHITAVTMQGFGTSDATYDNAMTLMKSLGCTIREIPIRESVLQHFADIGHNPENHDVVYENAQARERTQILLDLANAENGIVVGTGDLSELALGFCTFAGDQISSYSVNACVTKTMIRYMVQELANTARFSSCKDCLMEVLNTPISPELLPPSDNGVIRQKTEEILGSYHLHDFFLYYFVFYRFCPSKLLCYAQKAFKDEFDSNEIKEKLTLFLRRFCSAQFKRSCAPDSAILTELNLANHEFSMPSDISATLFLNELENK